MVWRHLILFSTAVAIVPIASPAQAAITTFTSRASFDSAIGGSPSFLVDFNNFTVDADFRTTTVDAGPFSLRQQGANVTLGNNLIDAVPFAPISSNLNFDGSTYASILIGPGINSIVVMTFDSPVVAFGGDFVHPGNGTLLTLEISAATGVMSVQVPGTGLTTGFFGFTVAPNEQFTSITFRNSNLDGFGLDNVALESAVLAVPEPKSFAIYALGTVIFAGLRCRRKLLNRLMR